MKYEHVYALFLMVVFFTSCGGQNKTDPPKEKIKSETKEASTSGWIYTKYEYTDSIGKSLIVQNSFPKGGTKYTDPDGEVYYYAVFFTRIINETDNPLELMMDFSLFRNVSLHSRAELGHCAYGVQKPISYLPSIRARFDEIAYMNPQCPSCVQKLAKRHCGGRNENENNNIFYSIAYIATIFELAVILVH